MKHDPQASEDLYRDAGIDQLPAAEDELIDLQGEGVRVTVICGCCNGQGCDLCDHGEIEVKFSEVEDPFAEPEHSDDWIEHGSNPEKAP